MVVNQEDSVFEVLEESVNYRHGTKTGDVYSGKEFLERLNSKFEIRILEHKTANELVFEMINIDISFANALRRIMISEVNTMAIEKIYMWNNSSIIPDEVLSHRIGLIPIFVDPRYFTTMDDPEGNPTDRNTVVFRLKVACPRKPPRVSRDEETKSGGANTTKPSDDSVMQNTAADKAAASTVANYEIEQQNKDVSENKGSGNGAPITPNITGRPYTKHVYSKDLIWIPQGDHETRLPHHVKPIHDDILIAKLRPGQIIELEAHARVSNGKDHAKYSPVATATYRLMPQIHILQPIYDEHADRLIMYEPGVFKLEPTTHIEGHYQKAVLTNPYACTMSRNYMRDPFLKQALKINRLENHFIFSIESVGVLPASIILSESIKILKEKCANLSRLLEDHQDEADL